MKKERDSHQTADDSEAGRSPPPEQRAYRRIRYWSVQQIAIGEGLLPTDSDAFHRVQCFDISQGGFSFLTNDRPTSTSLLLAMQVRQETAYMKAEVVSCRPSKHKAAAYIVGCRFTERMA